MNDRQSAALVRKFMTQLKLERTARQVHATSGIDSGPVQIYKGGNTHNWHFSQNEKKNFSKTEENSSNFLEMLYLFDQCDYSRKPSLASRPISILLPSP